jgi:hypothetical protein
LRALEGGSAAFDLVATVKALKLVIFDGVEVLFTVVARCGRI